MDNRILNINGALHEGFPERDLTLLRKALELAFIQDNYLELSETRCNHFAKTKKSGLILMRYNNERLGSKELPCPLDIDGTFQLVLNYLKSEEAKTIETNGWDRDADHDGDNGPGWRLFVEDWGHVEGFNGVICAIKPCFMWYGK